MKKILFLVLIVITIIAFVSVYIFLNRSSKIMSEAEKETAIAKILGRKPNFTDDAPKGNVEFKGKYISFMYPATAAIRKQLLNGREVSYTGLEQLIFKIERPKLTLYMEVIEAPQNVENLNDYPSVKLRQIQPNIYDQKDIFVGNTKGLSFKKQSTTGFEKTGFFFLNDKIYSFSIQGPDFKAAEELFNKIIASVRFL